MKLRQFLLLIFFSGTIVLAESKIVIEGNSSIYVDSKSQNTQLIAGNIETKRGGKFAQIDNDRDKFIQAECEILSTNDNIPESFVIEEAYPNPFNPTTNIKYGISRKTDVTIMIYDVSGRLIKKNRIRNLNSGWYEFSWNGLSENKSQVSSGTYLIIVHAGNEIRKQKVTYVK